MYSYNRRPYITREPEKKIDKSPSEHNENTDINISNPIDNENIKLLLEKVNDIKNSVQKLEESVIDICSKLVSLENHFDNEKNSRNVQSQCSYKSVNNKTYPQNSTDSYIRNQYESEERRNTPMMPGTGFSNITAEYLKNLSKNK